MMTKYAIDNQELIGISESGMLVPVAPTKEKRKILEINICNPRLKYGLKLAAFFFVYKVPKAQVIVAAIERIIPN